MTLAEFVVLLLLMLLGGIAAALGFHLICNIIYPRFLRWLEGEPGNPKL